MAEWVGVCVCVRLGFAVVSVSMFFSYECRRGDMCINGGGGWESVSVYM